MADSLVRPPRATAQSPVRHFGNHGAMGAWGAWSPPCAIEPVSRYPHQSSEDKRSAATVFYPCHSFLVCHVRGTVITVSNA